MLKPIILKTSTGFVYFDYSDVILCSAEGNYTNIFSTDNNNPVKVLHSISYIEREYSNELLIRCHKSHIINLEHLEKLILKTHQVQLKNKFIVPLSNSCWKKIRIMSDKMK